ncbi:DUF1566 domain-containing protein [bacterium]|nr:MAG: DUF1566 domain-containing protein [bacterium]
MQYSKSILFFLCLLVCITSIVCDEKSDKKEAPTVTTASITSITVTTASGGGDVTADGGADITARGLCWSTSQNPTIEDSHTTEGSEIGPFASSITGLSPNTMYYVKAYATNDVGTSYGNQVTFTTNPILVPTVTTTTITNITSTSASTGGNVTADGGAPVTARGVCWNTSANPTITDSITSNGTGTGAYVSSMGNLLPNTTYYVRAYVTNSAGTNYGNEVSFATGVVVLPTVTTASMTNITTATASSGGNVTADGGAAVTARGVCWSTSQNPTIADAHTSNGTGTGLFISSITSLTPNTTYYVKAYVTNSVGTSYGSEESFTTLTIGDSYQGGKIFYILQPGDSGYVAGQSHGLIAAPTDQGTSIQWYNGSNIVTGAAGIAIGTGNTNTNAIVAAQGAGSYAAKLCYDLVLDSYNDWYLPSKDELNKLYVNKAVVGGFGDSNYWSSSEDNVYIAEYQYFGDGGQYSSFKYESYYVRAIRAF